MEVLNSRCPERGAVDSLSPKTAISVSEEGLSFSQCSASERDSEYTVSEKERLNDEISKKIEAVEETMEFFTFALKDDSTYEGTVLFNFRVAEGRPDAAFAVLVDGKDVTISRERPSKLHCEVTLDMEDFLFMYSGAASPSWLAKKCYSGQIKVHRMAYRNLTHFASSFDYSTERWNDFYAWKEQASISPCNTCDTTLEDGEALAEITDSACDAAQKKLDVECREWIEMLLSSRSRCRCSSSQTLGNGPVTHAAHCPLSIELCTDKMLKFRQSFWKVHILDNVRPVALYKEEGMDDQTVFGSPRFLEDREEGAMETQAKAGIRSRAAFEGDKPYLSRRISNRTRLHQLLRVDPNLRDIVPSTDKVAFPLPAYASAPAIRFSNIPVDEPACDGGAEREDMLAEEMLHVGGFETFGFAEEDRIGSITRRYKEESRFGLPGLLDKMATPRSQDDGYLPLHALMFREVKCRTDEFLKCLKPKGAPPPVPWVWAEGNMCGSFVEGAGPSMSSIDARSSRARRTPLGSVIRHNFRRDLEKGKQLLLKKLSSPTSVDEDEFVKVLSPPGGALLTMRELTSD